MTMNISNDQSIPHLLAPHDVTASANSSTLCSRLLFCSRSGRMVHVRSGSLRIQKDSFEFGLLCPKSVEERRPWSVEEASPLMLSQRSVSFPLSAHVSLI